MIRKVSDFEVVILGFQPNFRKSIYDYLSAKKLTNKSAK